MSLLASYIIRRLLLTYLVTALAMGSLLWLLELLERLEDGMSGSVDVLLMALQALRVVPDGLLDLLPVIAVLATAATMSVFQARSELTVMRASGVSIWNLTAIALAPGFALALLALAALQWVTPLLHEGPERLMGASLGESGLWHPWHGLWVRQGDEFLNVQSLRLGRIPTEVDIYEFADDGGLARHVHAEQALILDTGQWSLEQVRIRDFSLLGQAGFVERLDTLRWESFLSGRQLELLLSPPAGLPLYELWQYVDTLNARDQEVAEFEMVLWRRLALPLACLGMVLIAMAMAAVPLKSRAASVRIVSALAIGLGYQMAAEVVSYAGLVLRWPVIPVALGPPVALAVLSWWLLARSR